MRISKNESGYDRHENAPGGSVVGTSSAQINLSWRPEQISNSYISTSIETWKLRASAFSVSEFGVWVIVVRIPGFCVSLLKLLLFAFQIRVSHNSYSIIKSLYSVHIHSSFPSLPLYIRFKFVEREFKTIKNRKNMHYFWLRNYKFRLNFHKAKGKVLEIKVRKNIYRGTPPGPIFISIPIFFCIIKVLAVCSYSLRVSQSLRTCLKYRKPNFSLLTRCTMWRQSNHNLYATDLQTLSVHELRHVLE